MCIYQKLQNIQEKLKAPKSQYNNFGKYNYRNCEDILEAVKPLLKENNCVLIINDSINQIGDRYYVEATAKLIDAETKEEIIVKASAREEENKKGMDGSQVTGASSSYARKYALNGLFAIDDTKDSDSSNQGDKSNNQPQQTNSNIISDAQRKRLFAICKDELKIRDTLKRYGYESSKDIKKTDYDKICKELEAV